DELSDRLGKSKLAGKHGLPASDRQVERFLSLGHADFDATISVPALRRGVVSHRILLAEPPRSHARAFDSEAGELVQYGRGTRLRQLHVVRGTADIVRVTADVGVRPRIGLDDSCDLTELFLRCRRDTRRAGLEFKLMPTKFPEGG